MGAGVGVGMAAVSEQGNIWWSIVNAICFLCCC